MFSRERAGGALTLSDRQALRAFAHQGVGLCFELPAGLPLDPDDFALLLMAESCHPQFGQAIARDLVRHGVRCTTVMGAFESRWLWVASKVARFGVKLSRCWPRIAPVRETTAPVTWPRHDDELLDAAQRLEAAYQAAQAAAVTA